MKIQRLQNVLRAFTTATLNDLRLCSFFPKQFWSVSEILLSRPFRIIQPPLRARKTCRSSGASCQYAVSPTIYSWINAISSTWHFLSIFTRSAKQLPTELLQFVSPSSALWCSSHFFKNFMFL